MTEYAIDIVNVTKRYAEHTAVRDLTLRVPTGSVYGLLGPNGAGKTTTIRMILNIIAPDTGTIHIFGRRSSDPKITERLGYLPEERGLYRKMQVRRVLKFLAELLCDSVCIIARGEKVLDGVVTDVKEEHGQRNIALALEGNGMAGVATILRDHSLVKRADDQNRFFEIELAPGADPQALLKRIVDSGASVQRFEMIQPSLHQIFLQKVGARGVEEGISGHGYALGDHQARVRGEDALEVVSHLH